MHWRRASRDCPAQKENFVTAERLVSYRRHPMRAARDGATVELVITTCSARCVPNPRPVVSVTLDCHATLGRHGPFDVTAALQQLRRQPAPGHHIPSG